MRWLVGIIEPMDMNLSKLSEMVKDMEAWHVAITGSQSHTTEWLNNNKMSLLSAT